MRKLLLTTAAVAAAIGLVGCGNSDPDTLIDKRDGQKYRTVVIGGTRWMAQNLNYRADSSWCYENRADSCNKYGRLYTWDAAMKACPAGWKLPSREDWKSLVAVASEEKTAGKKLKSKNGWNNRNDGSSGNGTDDYGFSALPGGSLYSADGSFYGVGYDGYLWTATEDYYGNYAYNQDMDYDYDGVREYGTYDKSDGFSVRCVADRP